MPDPRDIPDSAALETVLGTALRADRLDPEAEQRALAAFRAAAHGAGAHRARPRRQDDWRPREGRSLRRPVRMTFGVVLASLTLGGVAVAAIGSADSSTDGAGTGRVTARPSAVAPNQAGGTASSAPSGRPSPAQDTEAHCRAYKHVEGNGKALDATGWQRLVAAAGGKDKVAAYCSTQLTRATAAPSKPAGKDKPGKRAANAGNGTAGNAGASGDGTPGADPGGTHNETGNGQASGGTGRAGDGTGSGKHR
ncbi:hypothetical protein ACGFOU_02600 [Streptomyces sp. NPDC048595]|uniref:hypothetical protein n=1 Tax=Streptomyces sp. NPDC048595 TaxID=3365576 RepID=UPI00371239CE